MVTKTPEIELNLYGCSCHERKDIKRKFPIPPGRYIPYKPPFWVCSCRRGALPVQVVVSVDRSAAMGPHMEQANNLQSMVYFQPKDMPKPYLVADRAKWRHDWQRRVMLR